MKKLIFFVMAAIVLSACTTEEYYDYTGYSWVSEPIRITNDDWKDAEDDSGFYLRCRVSMPEITRAVFEKGVVDAFLYHIPRGQTESVKSLLPYSDFWGEYDNEGNLVYKWEEQVTMEYGVGFITFIAKFDDHAYENPQYPWYEFVVNISLVE
jgi:hypothetical protein